MRSIVYLIGAGPGDPGLITVRGQQCVAAADVVVYDHLVHPRLLRHARPDAERIDVGVTAQQSLEQDAILLPARRKSARGQDRRPPQVGRPVPVRPRRLRGAVPARAGRPLRGRARRAGPHRHPVLRGRDHHVRRRRRYRHAHPRARGRRQDDPAGARLQQPGPPGRHAALLHRPGTAAGVSERARRARTFARRRGGPRLRRHAADPGNDCRDARGPREGRQALARSTACRADRRPRRGVARTPAVVRRASAVREARARHAAARAGGRAGRPARSHGRRRRGSADDPDGTPRRLRPARRGVRAGRDVQLDHLLERGRRRRVHRPAAEVAARSARPRRREALRRRPGDGRAPGAPRSEGGPRRRRNTARRRSSRRSRRRPTSAASGSCCPTPTSAAR